MRPMSRINRRSYRTRRSVNERMDLVEVVFALQSQENPEMFVASEDAGVTEAEDDETGIPFTDSMDENIVMLFPTHEEAKQFAEDNGLIDTVKIVAVSVHPDEEEAEAEEVEECYGRRMGESLRLRRARAARRLGESRIARRMPVRRPRRLGESRLARRATRMGRFGRR